MTDFQPTVNQDVSEFVERFWRILFGAKDIHHSDSFFDLGGTSLTAIRFITAVENRFGVNALSPEELYEDPVFGSIIATISKNAGC